MGNFGLTKVASHVESSWWATFSWYLNLIGIGADAYMIYKNIKDDGRTELSQSTENLAQIISMNLLDLWNCLLEERSDLSIVFDTVAKRFDMQVT